MKRYTLLKRSFDFILSLYLILLLWPFILIIAVIIKCSGKGPVFFKQKRVGKDNQHFIILKFRTMRADTPKDMPTHLLENPDTFITRIGKILRKTSLDELPQVFNILKGEMSFVGPRPALWNQYDLLAERNIYNANNILPGLTGWAQVNGRDDLSIEEKAKFDGEYVKRMSLLFDLKVILITVRSVIRRDGVTEGAKQTNIKEANL